MKRAYSKIIILILLVVVVFCVYLYWPKDTNAVGEIKTALFDNY